MSCSAYTNNSNLPLTMVAGTLPPGFVHETWQDTFETFVRTIAAQLPGTYSSFVVSSTTPGADDQDKLWLKVASDCRPIGLYLYFGGAWVQVGSNVFYGVDVSATVNVITVASTTPVVNSLQTGQTFLVKAALTNTGACVATINTPMAVSVPIKKDGTTALVGYEFVAGGILELVYDGTYFQLLNPRTDVTIPAFSIENNSFETDLDGDTVPDKWVQVLTGTATGIQYSTDAIHGCFSYKVTVPGGTANGYAKLTNLNYINVDGGAYVHVSWWIKSTVAALPLVVTIDWYDCGGIFLSTSTIYSEATNNPIAIWYKMAGVAQAPAGAANFKITLQTGDNVTNYAAATVLWDDVRVERPVFSKTATASASGTYSWLCPAGVYQVRVSCNGAGGGGGGGESGPTRGGCGGGGGGHAESYIVVVPGTAYAIVVGLGGTGGVAGAAGVDGTSSTFSATVVIGNGGTKGSTPTVATPGTGGGGTGTIVLSGTNGALNVTNVGGAGGDCVGGGMGGKSVNGSSPGGGGGGSVGATTAKNGADGSVTVEY